MDKVSQRASRAAESILGNESLTSNLDDAAAQVLIDWGIDCAEMIAQRTAGLGETEADEVITPRLRATRKLMRHVNQTIPKLTRTQDESNRDNLEETLDAIIAQASVIYGPDFKPPTPEQRTAFLKQNIMPASEIQPPAMIKKLRTFIETPTEGLHSQEESDEQEKQEVNPEQNDPEQSGSSHRRFNPRDLWKLLFGDRR